jgi:hypothetical protein
MLELLQENISLNHESVMKTYPSLMSSWDLQMFQRISLYFRLIHSVRVKFCNCVS